ncbi:MAG: helix-turn-helix transcriptional regulator [Bacillota bacterium]|nr:helix-turn-helix transcriptional regulator [Bacillota bacterium]
MRTKARGAETKIYKNMAEFISARILSARKEKGLSQSQLAKAAKLSVSFMCEIEHGKVLPSLIVYSELCRLLEIEPVIPFFTEQQ